MARGKKSAGKTKSIFIPSLEPAADKIRDRLTKANLAVKELTANGGKAVDAPFGVGKKDPSPLRQARTIVKLLEQAIVALENACPNDFSNEFVLPVLSRRAGKKR